MRFSLWVHNPIESFEFLLLGYSYVPEYSWVMFTNFGQVLESPVPYTHRFNFSPHFITVRFWVEQLNHGHIVVFGSYTIWVRKKIMFMSVSVIVELCVTRIHHPHWWITVCVEVQCFSPFKNMAVTVHPDRTEQEIPEFNFFILCAR